MATHQWHTLTLRVTPEHSDASAQFLLDAGCEGVEVRDLAVRFDESEDATLEPLSIVEVVGYLEGETATAEHRVRAAQSGGVEAELHSSPVREEDWANSWREHFPPLRIGRFWVAPPWADVPEDGAIVLRIDPGLAFGTGQHPTTRMCLELLGEYLPHEGESLSLLDVGCGSGVLSIAAAKLGAQVTASDPDRFCVEATEENALANATKVEVHERSGAAWTKQTFDVVVANLMSDLLIGMRDELARVVRPGGLLLVSGISLPRADEVESALQTAGLQTLERRVQDGESRGDYIERWAAFALRAGEEGKG